MKYLTKISMTSLASILVASIIIATSSITSAKDNYVPANTGDDFASCMLDDGKVSDGGSSITCCVPLGDGVYKKCTTCLKGSSSCRTSTVFDRYRYISEELPKKKSLKDRFGLPNSQNNNKPLEAAPVKPVAPIRPKVRIPNAPTKKIK